MKYEINKYKDGQVTAKIKESGNLHIKIRGNSYEDLFRIASIKEAWDNSNSTNKNLISILTIYCLIGQRSDRRFNDLESFDLKIIANFINAMNFDKVEILHPHSSITLALINNSKELKSHEYVKLAYYDIGNPILVSPDAGSYKTTHEIAEKLNADLVPSNKVRINGLPIIKIQGNVKDKDCLIVDDLADGGRTFKFLAEELKSQGALRVYLYVTHAQFNYGFDELKESIDHIYCTNSYKDIVDQYVTQIKVL
ncbi:phosphoribosyltransferase family protein [Seonamhaeicola maritimus]|uniref:Ribose-phosphate pyrophosphokinase n=1 Tax=Seonamhaeicola maritimus TaxID=2591822 RepID=A0A5C7GHZ4_9FLAO|nr:phosphoribosyltransferase family protein [Seonamhaeicola maritimus]TXG36931.1 ribose-phosphate pyrophosphokinase [Seonamhaeicola maritimus]